MISTMFKNSIQNPQHDQTYFVLKDVKHLFTDDEVDYDPIFVRSSMEKGFEEYEIAGEVHIIL